MAKKEEVVSNNLNDQLNADLSKTSFGDIIDIAENIEDMTEECTSTGFPQLDAILHRKLKGLVHRRDLELYSKNPGSGKTSLAIQILKNWQLQLKKTAIIDVERTLTTEYLHQMGIVTDPKDNPNVYAVRIVRPKEALSAEQVLDVVQQTSNTFDLIVVDSLAALDLQANLEKTSEDSVQMGGIAKKFSDYAKKNLSRNATIIWINQTRQAIGGYNPTGNIRYNTCGGRALLFFSSIRLELDIVEKIKDKNDEVYGMKVRVNMPKNKLSPPYRSCDLTYINGEGFSTAYDYFDIAVKSNIIQKKGGWFVFGDLKIQGEFTFYNKMKADKELFEAVKQAVEGFDPLGDK